MTQAPSVTLNDGKTMPQFGLGVWRASDTDARAAVKVALEAGYRSIDTAAIYGNEGGVGAGLRDAGVPRDDVFVTTKIWNTAQGRASTPKAFEESLTKLGLAFVDLLLIHWPTPKQDRYLETWQAMIELRDAGLVRSIGVSNFNVPHLKRLIEETGVTPVVNQIEVHPYMQQKVLRDAHLALHIQTESWSPLAQGKALDDPIITAIARKHGKTPSQVIIRWHLDAKLVVIPKSVTPSRIQENAGVFDFELDHEDLDRIATLDRGERLGPNPDTFD